MNPFSTTRKRLVQLLAFIVFCFSSHAQVQSDTMVAIVSFDLKKQPVEASGRASAFPASNIISSSTLKPFPDGAKIVDVQFTFPKLKTVGNSLASDVVFGFSGALETDYNYGDHAPEFATDFNFQCLYENFSVKLKGGKINLHYYDIVDDNRGVEAFFNTGKDVASLAIRYTVPRTESNDAPINISDETQLEEYNSGTKVSLYPNPSKGQVFLVMTEENAIATVCDFQGKVITESKVQNGDAIDLSQVAPGIYAIVISSSSSRTSHKIQVL